MALTVKLTIDSVLTDITSSVVSRSIARSQVLHNDLKTASDQAEFYLRKNAPKAIINALLSTTDYVTVTIQKNASDYFVGVLTDTYKAQLMAYGFESVKLSCEDFTDYKLGVPWVSTNLVATQWVGCDICKPSDQANSIIHKIAALAGVTVDAGAVAVAKNIDYFVVADNDNQTYTDVLNSLLYEFGYCFGFTASGKLTIHDLNVTSTTTSKAFKSTGVLTTDNILGTIETTKAKKSYKYFDIKWFSRKQYNGRVVFSDTTGGDNANKCNIAVAPDGYYPQGATGSVNVYGTYKLDDGTKVLMVGGITANIVKDSGLNIVNLENFYKGVHLKMLNASHVAIQSIRKLELIGTNIIVQDVENHTTSGNLVGSKRLNYDAKHLHTGNDAASLAKLLENYYKYSPFTYSLKSKSTYEIGDIVQIQDSFNTGMNVFARISKKEDSDQVEGIISYTLYGVSPYSLDTTASIPTNNTNQTNNPVSTLITQVAGIQTVIEGIQVGGPVYKGRYNAAHPAIRNAGDWWLIYDTDDTPIQRGVWYDNAGTPTRLTGDDSSNARYFADALVDVLWATVNGYGAIADYGSITFVANLISNAAFIANLQSKEIQFEKFVASIADSGLISKNWTTGTDGTKQLYVGKNPRRLSFDTGLEYEFALQEYLGDNGIPGPQGEIWMKHFLTKKMRNGMYGLMLAGALMSCDGVLTAPGKVWTVAPHPITSNEIRSVVFDNGTGLVSAFGGKIARSTDGGITWSGITIASIGLSSFRLTLTNGIALAFGANSKIARSTDGGLTWSGLISNPFQIPLDNVGFGSTISDIATDGGITIAVGQGGKISRSTDGGLTWSGLIANPFGTSTIAKIVFKDGLCVAAGGTGIARSTDGGLTWSSLITTPLPAVNVLAMDNGIIIAAESNKIARSTDGGQTWSGLIPNPFDVNQISAIAINNGMAIACSNGGMLARSADGGLTWSEPGTNQSYNPLGPGSAFYSIAVDKPRMRWVAVGSYLSYTAAFIMYSDWLEAGAGIVERGTTTNGTYTKFSDGTMECRGEVPVTAYPQAITFPNAFIDTSWVMNTNFAKSSATTGGVICNLNQASKSVSGGSIWCYSTYSGNMTSGGTIHYTANGRWK
jgi:photosystem II stability/assembly factor-like uncharacterized protein